MPIRHKRKPSTGYVWLNTDLVDGQIGLNTVDGTIHLKKTDNSIETIKNYDNELDGKKDDFAENSAFNKDYGSMAGTTCEGDDSRLDDDRDPNPHAHIISDVTNLETELNTKVQDHGEWVQSHYDYNDQVSKDGYLTRCINPLGTDDYPIPINIGDPFLIYENITDLSGTPIPEPTFSTIDGGANVIKSGILYTYDKDIQTLQVLVNVPELSSSTNYKIFVIEDPFGTPKSHTIYDPFLEENVFTIVLANNAILQDGTELLIYIESYTTSTDIQHNFQMKVRKAGVGEPNSGESIHTADGLKIRISTTDNLSVDISSELASAKINDTYKVIQNSNTLNWETVEFNDVGTLLGIAPNEYYEFDCHIIDQGNTPNNNSICASTLSVFAGGSTLYLEDTDYFLNTNVEGTLQGFLQVGNTPHTLSNNAYGIDLKLQNVEQSEDWQIRASGSGGGSSSGGSTIEVVDDLITQDAHKALSANQGYVLDQKKPNIHHQPNPPNNPRVGDMFIPDNVDNQLFIFMNGSNVLPIVLSSVISLTNGINIITVQFDRDVDITGDVSSQFDIVVNSTPSNPISVQQPGDPTIITITMGSNFLLGDIVSWQYNLGSFKVQELDLPYQEIDNGIVNVVDNQLV